MYDSGTVPNIVLVLELELVDAVFRIGFDYEHRFAEHEHDLPFMIAALIWEIGTPRVPRRITPEQKHHPGVNRGHL